MLPLGYRFMWSISEYLNTFHKLLIPAAEYEDMGGASKRPRMDNFMMPPGMPGGGGPPGGIPMPPMPGW